MQQVIKAIQYFAEHIPERTALIDENRHITYRELEQASLRWAHHLQKRRIAYKGTVIVLMNNSVRLMEILLALAKLPVRIVLINGQLSGADIALICERVRATSFITEQKFKDKAEELRPFSANPTVIFVEEEEQSLKQEYPVALEMETTEEVDGLTHIVFFTSGSTGKPKGIKIDKRKFDIGHSKEAMKSVHLIARPIYYRAHFSSICFMLQEGKTIYLSDTVTPEKLCEIVELYQVTHMILGAYDLLRTVQWLEKQNKMFPATIEEIISTGTTLAEKLKHKLPQFGPTITFVDLYGTSECGAITLIDQHEWRTKPKSVGRPLFFSMVEIVDEANEIVGANTPGEICVKTPFQMDAYLEDDTLNEDKFRDDFIRTGDIGYVDDDGYLYLIDRKNNAINQNGNLFHPSEVEQIMREHPEIRDVIVVNFKDEYQFQVPVAYVELVDRVKLNDQQWQQVLNAYCRERLAEFKIPTCFVIVDQLPRNAAGKVDQTKLKKIAAND